MSHTATYTICRPLVDIAEKALRAWGDDLSREQAERLLDMWMHRGKLNADEYDAVLSRFVPAEHEPQPYVDYLPDRDIYERDNVYGDADPDGHEPLPDGVQGYTLGRATGGLLRGAS